MLLTQEAITHSEMILSNLQIVTDEKHLDGVLDLLTAKHEKPIIVSWLNAHSFTVAQSNEELAANILGSSFLFRDGIGICLLLRLFGKNAGLNMNGTDLIPKILGLFAGKSVALLGSQEPYLSQASDIAAKMGCRVILRMDGFQRPEDYLKNLAAQKVDLIILGMGVPRQEQIARLIAEKNVGPVVIINGGAILDFMSGRFARAPQSWRRQHLEWLFRLMHEPRRLWRRYLIGGPLFVFYTAQIVFALRSKTHKYGLTS